MLTNFEQWMIDKEYGKLYSSELGDTVVFPIENSKGMFFTKQMLIGYMQEYLFYVHNITLYIPHKEFFEDQRDYVTMKHAKLLNAIINADEVPQSPESIMETSTATSDRNEIYKKPPLGIMPKRFWDEKRIKDLSDAIHRYIADDRYTKLVHDWIYELETTMTNYLDLYEE